MLRQFLEPAFLEPTGFPSGNLSEAMADAAGDMERALVRRTIEGDEDAFTALYRERQGGVYRFALQMTGSVAVAEDVTQEVFLALIEHGQRFDPARGTLASFLYGIARNLVLRRLEKDRAAEPDAAMEEFAGGVDLLEDLMQRETVDQVRRAVLSLPEVYREAVVLCDLQDVSYREAAAALDCPVGTLRSRLNRGRALLAEKLSKANVARCFDEQRKNRSGVACAGRGRS